MIHLDSSLVWVLASATVLAGQVVKTNEAAPDTLIMLQRGACEQRCAVYRLVIFADGTVIYQGEHFVRRAGLIKSGVSPAALTRLIGDIETSGFFQLEGNYGYANKDRCDSIDSDGPTAILTVSNRGRAKTILHNQGCVGTASKRLTELEDKIDRAVGVAKWIK